VRIWVYIDYVFSSTYTCIAHRRMKMKTTTQKVMTWAECVHEHNCLNPEGIIAFRIIERTPQSGVSTKYFSYYEDYVEYLLPRLAGDTVMRHGPTCLLMRM